MVSNNYSDLLISVSRKFVDKCLREKKRTKEKKVLSALVTACATYHPAHVSRNKISDMLGFQTEVSILTQKEKQTTLFSST